MSEDVARWCQECQFCTRRKPGPGKGKSALKQIKVYQPMSVVAVDILGLLPRTNNGNEYIIVCGCYYTKWKEAFVVPNQTAATVADMLVQEVFLKLGVPVQLHTDQGQNFESDLFKAICDLLGVEKTRTVPYNPKYDSLTERFNRTLDLTYRIQKNRESSPFVVLVDHRKPFVGTKHPRNWLLEPRILPSTGRVEIQKGVPTGESVPLNQETEGEGPQGTFNEIPVQIRGRRERVVKPREVYSPEQRHKNRAVRLIEPLRFIIYLFMYLFIYPFIYLINYMLLCKLFSRMLSIIMHIKPEERKGLCKTDIKG